MGVVKLEKYLQNRTQDEVCWWEMNNDSWCLRVAGQSD